MSRRDQREREILDLFADLKAGRQVEARERGLSWRRTIKTWEHPDPEIDRTFLASLAEDEADRLSEMDRPEFTAALNGKVPINEYLEAHLKAANLATKTTSERRGLIGRFARWCDGEGLKLTDISRRVAGRYVAKTIEPMHRRTGKKHLTALIGYWDFLNRRGYVERFESRDNPWRDQIEPERRKKVQRGDRKDEERPFTKEEMKSLLKGTPASYGMTDQALFDMIRIAALSGMRLGEITGLWVEECTGNVFDIQEAKTEAGARKIPIHPDLKSIVARRIKGRDRKAPLFSEFAKMKNAGDTMGKRFKRHREACGVDDKRVGQRRSLVNFHSFRRWFVTEAERAGQPENVVAAVVGHSEGERKKKITFGVYSGGPSEEQKQACVKAVKLPL